MPTISGLVFRIVMRVLRVTLLESAHRKPARKDTVMLRTRAPGKILSYVSWRTRSAPALETVSPEPSPLQTVTSADFDTVTWVYGWKGRKCV